MRQRARHVLIVLLTIGLLAFFLRDANMSEVWAETRRADARLLVAALATTALTYVLRAYRWQFLLAPIGATHFKNAFRTTVIGFAATSLLPARAGEVIRPYLLARRERLSATAAFATVILERLLDLLAVLILFAVFVLLGASGVVSGDPSQFARVKFGGLLAGAGAIVASAVLFALAGHPERLGRLALGAERILPGAIARAVARFVETFAQGLAVMRQPDQLALSLLLSFPLWLSIAAGIWLTSRAFHITFPFTASFLVMTILVVGVAMPTPGAIGGFHAAYQIAVQTFFATPTDRAIGGAIVLHAISFLPVAIVGVLFMLGEGITLSGARQLAESAGQGEATGAGTAGQAEGDIPRARQTRASSQRPASAAVRRSVTDTAPDRRGRR